MAYPALPQYGLVNIYSVTEEEMGLVLTYCMPRPAVQVRRILLSRRQVCGHDKLNRLGYVYAMPDFDRRLQTFVYAFFQLNRGSAL